MVTFSILIVAMTALALVFLLPPLLKKRSVNTNIEQEELTVNVYKDQLEELDNDLRNSVISQDQYDTAKADIERNLLQDMDDARAKAAQAQDEQRQPKLAIATAVIVPVLAVFLYASWGEGEQGLDPASATPQVKTEQHNNQSIEGMIAQLEARLQQAPNDGEGWLMLAKTYQFAKRYDDSVRVYQQIMAMGGDQVPDILASYADAIAMASGRKLVPAAIDQLEKALVIDPRHIKSLWLMGTAAYQDGDYKSALGFWERLDQALPPNSKDKQQINANINEVRAKLGMPAVAMQAAPEQSSGGQAQITGTVSLGGAVASRASPEDTVFVFARAASGPPMPLAVVRKQVKDLPFEFTLNDAMAMNPAMKLSSFPQVVVGARISKTGNAMPQSGDLEGFSGAVSSSGSEVNLTINQIR